jgi:hypothetical protein
MPIDLAQIEIQPLACTRRLVQIWIQGFRKKVLQIETAD